MNFSDKGFDFQGLGFRYLERLDFLLFDWFGKGFISMINFLMIQFGIIALQRFRPSTSILYFYFWLNFLHCFGKLINVQGLGRLNFVCSVFGLVKCLT